MSIFIKCNKWPSLMQILVTGKTVQEKGHTWEFSLLPDQLFYKSKTSKK